MKKAIYITLALTLFLLASAEKSFACSCLRTLEPVKKQVQKAFMDSTAIFTGEVLEINEDSTDKSSLLVKIRVSKVWKGELTSEVMVTTARDSAMCGYTFEIGRTYLVYANGAKDALMVSNCSRTKFGSYKGDIKYLDKFKKQKRASS